MGGDFLGGLTQGAGQAFQQAQQQGMLRRQLALQEESAKYQRKHLETQDQLTQMTIQGKLREMVLGERFASGFEPTSTQVPGPPPIEPTMAAEDVSPHGPMFTQTQPGPFAQARGLSPEQGKMMAGLVRTLGGDVEKAGKAFEFFFPDIKADKVTKDWLAYQAAGKDPAKALTLLQKTEKPQEAPGLLDPLTAIMTGGQQQRFFQVTDPAMQMKIMSEADKRREDQKAHEINLASTIATKAAETRQQQQPLSTVTQTQLTSLNTNLIHADALQDVPDEAVKRWVGYIKNPLKQAEQFFSEDQDFQEFQRKVKELRASMAFSRTEGGGGALTVHELAAMEGFIPTGREVGGITEFRAKLKNLTKTLETKRKTIVKLGQARPDTIEAALEEIRQGARKSGFTGPPVFKRP